MFGARSIEESDRFERQKAVTTDRPESPEHTWLEIERKHLILFFEQGTVEQSDEIRDLISEALDNPASRAELQKLSGESLPDASSVVEVLKRPDAPREFTITLLRAHADRYAHTNEQVRELGEEFKKEFLVSVQRAVADGFLSPDTDINLVQSRLDTTDFFYIDPVSGGSHASVSRSTEGGIGIAHEHFFKDSPDLRKHTFFHELVHAALSGRAMTASVVETSGQVMTHGNRKEGLRFDFERAPRGQRFGWMMGLNEGVTEYIAQHLSSVTDSVAYGIQILYMRNMAERGVPMSAFVHAYQEDYKLGEKGVQRLPKLAGLLKSIRTAMGEDWYNAQIRQLKTDYGWGL